MSSAACGKTYCPSKHACAIHIFHQPWSSSLVWEWEIFYILGEKQILRWKILSWLNISCGCLGESVLLAQHLETLGKNRVQQPRFWSNWYRFCLWCLPSRSICIAITAYSGLKTSSVITVTKKKKIMVIFGIVFFIKLKLHFLSNRILKSHGRFPSFQYVSWYFCRCTLETKVSIGGMWERTRGWTTNDSHDYIIYFCATFLYYCFLFSVILEFT